MVHYLFKKIKTDNQQYVQTVSPRAYNISDLQRQHYNNLDIHTPKVASRYEMYSLSSGD